MFSDTITDRTLPRLFYSFENKGGRVGRGWVEGVGGGVGALTSGWYMNKTYFLKIKKED